MSHFSAQLFLAFPANRQPQRLMTRGPAFRSNSNKDSSSIDVKRDARDESIRHQHERCGCDVLGSADATYGANVLRLQNTYSLVRPRA